jgi:hypothetical protein
LALRVLCELLLRALMESGSEDSEDGALAGRESQRWDLVPSGHPTMRLKMPAAQNQFQTTGGEREKEGGGYKH